MTIHQRIKDRQVWFKELWEQVKELIAQVKALEKAKINVHNEKLLLKALKAEILEKGCGIEGNIKNWKQISKKDNANMIYAFENFFNITEEDLK